MTWGAFLTRSLTFVLVVPLVLTKFSAADVALWYVFSSVATLQLQADLGFSPTFVRVIAFAMGGLKESELGDLRAMDAPRVHADPNWRTVELVCATMRVVYNRLTLIATCLLLTVGTAVVARPIGVSSDPARSWAAWAAIVIASTLVLRGNQYSAYLQGLDRVALVRRWEALTNVGAIGTSFCVLLFGGGILQLVVAQQCWLIANVGRNWLLARHVEGARYRDFDTGTIDRHVLRSVWPSAWRSGLGSLAGQVPLQFSGIFYAQYGPPAKVAAFLFSIHVLTAIRTFANAPFYSRIPLLARLRAQGRFEELVRAAKRGMRLSYWTFVVGIALAGLLIGPLAQHIGSNVAFVPPALWAALATAGFIERYGAMHLMLYSTTNHIVWHVANGVTALLFAVFVAASFRMLDWYALAGAYAAAYLLFYAPYTASRSYRELSVRPLAFERSVVAGPALAMIAYNLVIVSTS
jgi:hypothetical protein